MTFQICGCLLIQSSLHLKLTIIVIPSSFAKTEWNKDIFDFEMKAPTSKGRQKLEMGSFVVKLGYLSIASHLHNSDGTSIHRPDKDGG